MVLLILLIYYLNELIYCFNNIMSGLMSVSSFPSLQDKYFQQNNNILMLFYCIE
jgi:hypothetical protein